MVEIAIAGDAKTNAIRHRVCKIIEIGEPDEKFYRASIVEWRDTGQREQNRWKSAKGVNQPVWVIEGPKINAALRGEGNIRQNDMKRWIWQGYKDTVGV